MTSSSSTIDVDTGTDDTLVDVYKPKVKKMKKKKKRPKSTVTSESMRVYLSSVLERLGQRVSLDTLRPLPIFLGIDSSICFSAGAFSPPSSTETKSLVERWHTRMALNGAYFLTNYALVALGVAIVIALLHPGMLMVCSVVYALWWLHSYLIANQLIVFKNKDLATVLSITQRSTILTIVTFFAILWKCLLPVVSFVCVSGLLVVLHATMRDPQHFANQLNHDDEEEEDNCVLVERGDFI